MASATWAFASRRFALVPFDVLVKVRLSEQNAAPAAKMANILSSELAINGYY
jgi:hypothetical protein